MTLSSFMTTLKFDSQLHMWSINKAACWDGGRKSDEKQTEDLRGKSGSFLVHSLSFYFSSYHQQNDILLAANY